MFHKKPGKRQNNWEETYTLQENCLTNSITHFPTFIIHPNHGIWEGLA